MRASKILMTRLTSYFVSMDSMQLLISSGTGNMFKVHTQIHMDLTTLMNGDDLFQTLTDFHHLESIEGSVKLPVRFMEWA